MDGCPDSIVGTEATIAPAVQVSISACAQKRPTAV